MTTSKQASKPTTKPAAKDKKLHIGKPAAEAPNPQEPKVAKVNGDAAKAKPAKKAAEKEPRTSVSVAVRHIICGNPSKEFDVDDVKAALKRQGIDFNENHVAQMTRDCNSILRTLRELGHV